jgi:hypothetical protein
VRNWLLVTLASVLAAAGFIIAAAVANSSIQYAYLSPIFLGVAGGLTIVAGFLCGAALGALNTFCACAGARCATPCSSLRATLTAAMVVLGIQTSACLTAAFSAWIPFAGLVGIFAIAAPLFLQGALIFAAIAFLSQLSNCQAAPAG